MSSSSTLHHAHSPPNQRIESLLQEARERLNMGLAYYSEFRGEKQVIQGAVGDAEAYDLPPGRAIPLAETYCARMLSNCAPAVVPDCSENPVMVEHGFDENLAAYIGVPIQLSNGRVLGSLCCVDDQAHPELNQEHLEQINHIAHEVACALEAEGSGAAVPSESPEVSLTLWFANLPQAPSAARHALDAFEDHLTPRQMSDLTLLMSEMVTNAIRHADLNDHQRVAVEIVLEEDCIHGVVSDPGSGFEKPDKPRPHEDRPGGFGLVILDNLSKEWGVNNEGLFHVWFRIPLSENCP